MKIIYNNVIPIEGFTAINVFGILFARKEFEELNPLIINHEAIHTKLMRELLYVPYYIIYAAEYLFNIIRYRNKLKAYSHISFEKEAYRHQYDVDYLKNRKHYAQWRK